MGCENIDILFQENLAEWVYDEHKLVTYHYLSVTLGVHVNLAKQMLYQFYKDETTKESDSLKSERRLHAFYYVSGTFKCSDSENLTSTTTICRDDQLGSITAKFGTIYSLHVYAVEASVDEHNSCKSPAIVVQMLSKAFIDRMLDQKYTDTAVTGFGPFKSITAHNKIQTVSSFSSPISAASDEPKKPVQIETTGKKSRHIEPKIKTSSSPWTMAAKGKSASKKREAYADEIDKVKHESGSKKKTISAAFEGYKDVIDSDSHSGDDCNFQSSPTSSPPSPPSPIKKKQVKRKASESESPPPRNSVTRVLRRRIRVLSDSSEEDDYKHQDTARSHFSESDEDEVKPEVKAKNYFTKVEPNQPAKKKRKTKIVTTQVMDEDGYLVTKREKVSESESEGQDAEDPQPDSSDKSSNGKKKGSIAKPSTITKKDPESDESPTSQTSKRTKSDTKSPGIRTSSPPKKSASTKKSSAKSGNVPKTKQLTMTSFFTKKN